MQPASTAGKATAVLPQSQCHRTYFYIGGRYIDDGNDDGQHVMVEQMYVEKLSPVDVVKHPWPLVFIQGAGQTGTVSNIEPFYVFCRHM